MPSKSQFWKTLPRFLWGEGLSVTPGDLDERIFLTHTQFPRFVCEIWETDEIPEADSLDDRLVGQFIDRDGVAAWQCNAGFIAARWAYIDAVPKLDELHAIMMSAAMDYQFWNDASSSEFD